MIQLRLAFNEIDCGLNRYGVDCQAVCKCDASRGDFCDPMNGQCKCRAGYMGANCNTRKFLIRQKHPLILTFNMA